MCGKTCNWTFLDIRYTNLSWLTIRYQEKIYWHKSNKTELVYREPFPNNVRKESFDMKGNLEPLIK